MLWRYTGLQVSLFTVCVLLSPLDTSVAGKLTCIIIILHYITALHGVVSFVGVLVHTLLCRVPI